MTAHAACRGAPEYFKYANYSVYQLIVVYQLIRYVLCLQDCSSINSGCSRDKVYLFDYRSGHSRFSFSPAI